MNIITVNGRNYFNQENLAEMVEKLEAGEKISIYIDCIGHTRAYCEEASYVEALKEKFGDELIEDDKGHYKSYYYLNR